MESKTDEMVETKQSLLHSVHEQALGIDSNRM